MVFGKNVPLIMLNISVERRKQVFDIKLNYTPRLIAVIRAQLVEHCTGIAEVTGSNPAEA